jgi:hypothetical protein
MTVDINEEFLRVAHFAAQNATISWIIRELSHARFKFSMLLPSLHASDRSGNTVGRELSRGDIVVSLSRVFVSSTTLGR